jgi:DNA-binding SARP family transcriptional activator
MRSDQSTRERGPGSPADVHGFAAPPTGPELRIRALGGFRLDTREGPIDGAWLNHRPGQILKYLVCEHGRATTEQIAEALWPYAPPGILKSVRFHVHVLRSQLEPSRSRGASSYVMFANGAYLLNHPLVLIDSQVFDREANAGLRAFAAGDPDAAWQLESALELYEGDLLAEDPYALWTLAERDRLRDLAGRGLRVLSELRLAAGALEPAADALRRLVEMEPFDTGAQRRLLQIYLRQGRRSQAWRRYLVLRQQMLSLFGEELNFDFSELVSEQARQLDLM